jgi:hypothetical protein
MDVKFSRRKKMAKVSEKGRSAKTGQFVTVSYAKNHPGTTATRVVKPAPVTGSFSRADAKSAVLSVMHQTSKK